MDTDLTILDFDVVDHDFVISGSIGTHSWRCRGATILVFGIAFAEMSVPEGARTTRPCETPSLCCKAVVSRVVGQVEVLGPSLSLANTSLSIGLAASDVPRVMGLVRLW